MILRSHWCSLHARRCSDKYEYPRAANGCESKFASQKSALAVELFGRHLANPATFVPMLQKIWGVLEIEDPKSGWFITKNDHENFDDLGVPNFTKPPCGHAGPLPPRNFLNGPPNPAPRRVAGGLFRTLICASG